MAGHFTPKSICILGRQPALGLAELETVYGAEHVKPGPVSTALLDVEAFDVNFKNLGGCIKVARVLATLPYGDWPKILKYLRTVIPEHLQNAEAGKFTLGISLYGFEVHAGQINKDLLGLKKVIKSGGRPVRIVPNKEAVLSSAQVLHNQLTKKGAWELDIIKNGDETILAQTVFIQDIEAYAARDQARPYRDAKVGMLPPKLAQIIINLACSEDRVILDPFCGTGVILQEALLMKWCVLGSDIDERMVEYAKKNIEWLSQKYDINPNQYQIFQADATDYKWPDFGTAASELYLGRPLAKIPVSEDLKQIISDVNTITKKFLLNLHSQIPAGRRFCIAVPAWLDGNKVYHLPLIAKLTDMGYNRYDFVHVRNDDLLYFRESQIVARELLVLTKE